MPISGPGPGPDPYGYCFTLNAVSSTIIAVKTILLISPYWREEHRWMVSSYKLADLWQRLGYKVVVICMASESGVDKVSETLEVHRHKDIFLRDPWNYGIAFGFAGYVHKVAKEVKPDIIIVNKILFWSTFSIIRLRLARKRVILTTDALVGMTWWPRGRIPKVGAFLYAWTLGWLLLLLAKKIVTFHPQPPTLLRRLGIAKKVSVIPTGIDPSLYAKSDPSPDPDPKTTITYVGRLESVKGVDDYLAAVVPLKKDSAGLKIQVVGFYEEGHPLVKQYERDVVFTGLRDDIPQILGETDIFVLPSYSEGLSNAVMEAMSSRCACIASEVGGNCYLIQNGVSGLLFPAGDREALRAHIKRLLDDPAKRRAMGDAARERIEKEFSWEVVGERYRVLFDSICNDRD